MATFYHVDRLGEIVENTSFNLETEYEYLDIQCVREIYNESDAINTVKRLYPKGISNHGIRLLFIERSNTPEELIGRLGPLIENVFELVRRADFPDKPSRMESIFGWTSLKEAENFRDEYNGGRIFEISSERAFIGDQKFLSLTGTVIGTYEQARKYWSGERSQNPSLEVLIPLPQVIGNAI